MELEHIYEKVNEPLILEPDDWDTDEWNTILKLFGLEEAEKIEIRSYDFEALGLRKVELTEENWKEAEAHLNLYIAEYANIGWGGSFGLNGVLLPLKRRYDRGERTYNLYKEMMAVE